MAAPTCTFGIIEEVVAAVLASRRGVLAGVLAASSVIRFRRARVTSISTGVVTAGFSVLHLFRVDIHESARRHGIADEDIVHAYAHAIGWVRLGDDPPRYLLAGGDRAGNLLELVVIGVPDDPLVIHAMPLRKSTEQELFGVDQ